MTEGFRPVSNTPPNTWAGKFKFYGRMLVDLQILTIFRDLKKELPQYSGDVLDIGCGQSPYRFLLPTDRVRYYGIDIADAGKFDYNNPDITPFDGEHIPFDNERFSGVICTEVLEHVQHYQKLIDEMYRVMKPGAKAIVTIPWSARYHYIPYDFFRYTPSSLKTMFAAFSEVAIQTRGSDLSTIASKLVALWFRNLLPANLWKWILVPVWIALSPLLIIAVLLAHVALWCRLGSTDDPLGFTIIVQK